MAKYFRRTAEDSIEGNVTPEQVANDVESVIPVLGFSAASLLPATNLGQA